MVASEKLNSRIQESGRTQTQIAKEMGLSQSVLSLKIRNKRPFFLDEACVLAEILNISDDFFTYFFVQKIA